MVWGLVTKTIQTLILVYGLNVQHICEHGPWLVRSPYDVHTHVSAPAIGGEDLVLLVQVEDLDESQPVLDPDGV